MTRGETPPNVTYRDDNLLDSGADVLVNPVCCMPAVMGKGLALAFAKRFPAMRYLHGRAVERGDITPGQGTLVDVEPGQRVYLFPTKDHWRNPSQLRWIADGLHRMARDLDPIDGIAVGVRTVAIPSLGCGLGGLDWADVEPLILGLARRLPAVEFLVYPPQALP